MAETCCSPPEIFSGSLDDIEFKTYYQFRWRDASTQLYGDFDWVEDIKSYSKHEFWLELSYNFTLDILY